MGDVEHNEVVVIKMKALRMYGVGNLGILYLALFPVILLVACQSTEPDAQSLKPLQTDNNATLTKSLS